jgi:hypothetical protein
MTAENFDETLQTLMTRQPFRAFTVELHGGERFEIDSPRVAWSDGKAAAFVGPGGILHIFDNESVLQFIDAPAHEIRPKKPRK